MAADGNIPLFWPAMQTSNTVARTFLVKKRTHHFAMGWHTLFDTNRTWLI